MFQIVIVEHVMAENFLQILEAAHVQQFQYMPLHVIMVHVAEHIVLQQLETALAQQHIAES
jgi:hypothetical protein